MENKQKVTYAGSAAVQLIRAQRAGATREELYKLMSQLELEQRKLVEVIRGNKIATNPVTTLYPKRR